MAEIDRRAKQKTQCLATGDLRSTQSRTFFSGKLMSPATTARLMSPVTSLTLIGSMAPIAFMTSILPITFRKSMTSIQSMVSAVSVAGVVFFMASSLRAAPQDAPVAPMHMDLISNAVQFQITPNGERFLSEHLEEVLQDSNFSLRRGYFSKIPIKSSQPIRFEELVGHDPQNLALLNNVKHLLEEWLMGFELNEPQPEGSLESAAYLLSPNKLTLRSNLISKQKNHLSGAVFDLEIEAQKLSIGARLISMRDPRNPIFGTLGFVNPVLSSSANSVPFGQGQQPPLRLKITFEFSIDQNKKPKIKIIATKTNFSETQMQLSYKKLLPMDLTISGSGYNYPLSDATLTRRFEESKPRLIAELQKLIDQLADTDLPKMLTEKLDGSMPEILKQTKFMEPPARPMGSSEGDFVWGLELTQIKQNSVATNSQKYLSTSIALDAFVEDPMATKSPPLSKNARARGNVTFEGLAPNQYDTALAVDRGLLNRVLQLSYHRGYLKKVVDDKDPNQVTVFAGPPSFDTENKKVEAPLSMQPKFRLRLAIAQDMSGLSRIATDATINVGLEAIGHLQQKADHSGVSLILDRLDPTSVVVDPNTLTLIGRTIMYPLVQQKAREKVREASTKIEAQPKEIGTLPLPPEFFGQKLAIKSMKWSSSGHLIMFMNFEP